jgi:hypothetical protein
MARRFAAGNVRLADGDYEAWLHRRRSPWRTTVLSYPIALSVGRWLLVSERRTADGGTVSICTDVTELKSREFALVEAKDNAYASN